MAGTDSTLTSNFGNNVFDIASNASSTSNIKIKNGLPYSVIDNEIKLGFIVNPKLNMVIEAKMQFRNYDIKVASASGFKSNAVMFSFATNIFNRYYDLPVLF